VSTCSPHAPPPSGRHPGLDQRTWSARRPRRRRSRDAGQAAALGSGRPSCEPGTATSHYPFPSGPMQAGDHAARRPRGTSTHCAQPGRPATPSHSRSSAARTARRQRRGHRRPVRPDTWMHRTPGCPGHWTPDAWTLDVRSTGWTDIPRRTGRGGQGDDRPGRRPDILATGGHPGRLRGDGTCATALTATAPGQLPSTARHQAAPRRTALLGTNFGLSVERTATVIRYDKRASRRWLVR
jgi:hypothetical protein